MDNSEWIMLKLSFIYVIDENEQRWFEWEPDQILRMLLREMPKHSQKDLEIAFNRLISAFKKESIRMK